MEYSDRFVASGSGTKPNGNSPHAVAEFIRKNGLVEEGRWPFSSDIKNQEEYLAEVPAHLRKEARKWLRQWSFSHDWVITRDTRKEEKIELLTDALKFSPVGVSVFGWAEDNGTYVKAGNDNHWCLLIAGDRDYWYVLDSYAPHIKKLNKNYDFGFAKRYAVERVAKSWLQDLIDRITQ